MILSNEIARHFGGGFICLRTKIPFCYFTHLG